MNKMKRSSLLTRGITLGISLALLWPNISWPLALLQAPSAALAYQGQVIHLPENVGAIDQARLIPQEPLIVLVQDAHCNDEVQQNIVAIINYFVRQHHLKLVGEEGACQVVNVQKYRSFPDHNIRREVCGYFLRQGQITGAEYYAINSDQHIDLRGLEEAPLYQASRTLVSHFLNEEQLGLLQDAREMLDDAARKFCTPPLLKLEDQKNKFHLGKLELSEYMLWLMKQAQKAGLEEEQFKALHAFGRSLGVRPDPEKLYTDLDVLDRRLRRRLYTNPIQEELDQWRRRLDIMEKCVNISATREELQLVRSCPRDYSMQALLDYLQKHMQLKMDSTALDLLNVDKSMAEALQFYDLADQRSAVFVRELLGDMKQTGQSIALMTSGGFHSEGIIRALKAAGVGYLSVKPRLTKLDILNPYFSLLQGHRQPLERLLAKNQTILALPSRMPNGAYTPDEVIPTNKLTSVSQQVLSKMFELTGEMAAAFQAFKRTRSIEATIKTITALRQSWRGDEPIGVDLAALASANPDPSGSEALVVSASQGLTAVITDAGTKLRQAYQQLGLKDMTINFFKAAQVKASLKTLTKHAARISVMTTLLGGLLYLVNHGVSLGGPSVLTIGVGLILTSLLLQKMNGQGPWPTAVVTGVDMIMKKAGQGKVAPFGSWMAMSAKGPANQTTRLESIEAFLKKISPNEFKLLLAKKEIMDALTLGEKKHRYDRAAQVMYLLRSKMKNLTIEEKCDLDTLLMSFSERKKGDFSRDLTRLKTYMTKDENTDPARRRGDYFSKHTLGDMLNLLRNKANQMVRRRHFDKYYLLVDGDKKLYFIVYLLIKHLFGQNIEDLLPDKEGSREPRERIIDYSINILLGNVEKSITPLQYEELKETVLAMPDTTKNEGQQNVLKLKALLGEINTSLHTTFIRRFELNMKLLAAKVMDYNKAPAGAWPWMVRWVEKRFNMDFDTYRLRYAWWLENLIALAFTALVITGPGFGLLYYYTGTFYGEPFAVATYVIAQWIFYKFHYLTDRDVNDMGPRGKIIIPFITLTNLLLTPLFLLGALTPWIYLVVPLISILNHLLNNVFSETITNHLPYLENPVSLQSQVQHVILTVLQGLYIGVPFLRQPMRRLINRLGLPRTLIQGDLGGHLTEFKEHLAREGFIRPAGNVFYSHDIDVRFFSSRLTNKKFKDFENDKLLRQKLTDMHKTPETATAKDLANALNEMVRQSTPLNYYDADILQLPEHIQQYVLRLHRKQPLSDGEMQAYHYSLLDTLYAEGINIWQGGQGQVIQVGDWLDRGPDSIPLNDFLKRLQKDAKARRGKVVRLFGNHEWNIRPKGTQQERAHFYKTLAKHQGEAIEELKLAWFWEEQGVEEEELVKFLSDHLSQTIGKNIVDEIEAGHIQLVSVLDGKHLVSHAGLSPDDEKAIIDAIKLEHFPLEDNSTATVQDIAAYLNDAILRMVRNINMPSKEVARVIYNLINREYTQWQPGTFQAVRSQLFGHMPENGNGALDFSVDRQKGLLCVDTGMDYLEDNQEHSNKLGIQSYAMDLFGEIRLVRKDKTTGAWAKEEVYSNAWTWLKGALYWLWNVAIGKQETPAEADVITVMDYSYTLVHGMESIDQDPKRMAAIAKTLHDVKYFVIETGESYESLVKHVVEPLKSYFEGDPTLLGKVVIIYANGAGAFKLNAKGDMAPLWQPEPIEPETRRQESEKLILACCTVLKKAGVEIDTGQVLKNYGQWFEQHEKNGEEYFHISTRDKKPGEITLRDMRSKVALDLVHMSSDFLQQHKIDLVDVTSAIYKKYSELKKEAVPDLHRIPGPSFIDVTNVDKKEGLMRLLNGRRDSDSGRATPYLNIDKPLLVLLAGDSANDAHLTLQPGDITHPMMPLAVFTGPEKVKHLYPQALQSLYSNEGGLLVMQLARQMSRALKSPGAGGVIHYYRFSKSVRRLIQWLARFYHFKARFRHLVNWLWGIGLALISTQGNAAPAVPVNLSGVINHLPVNMPVQHSSWYEFCLTHLTLQQAGWVVTAALGGYLLYRLMAPPRAPAGESVAQSVGQAYLSDFLSPAALLKGTTGPVAYQPVSAGPLQYSLMILTGRFWHNKAGVTFELPAWLMQKQGERYALRPGARPVVALLVKLAGLQHRAGLAKHIWGLRLEAFLDDLKPAWRIRRPYLTPAVQRLAIQSMRWFHEIRLRPYWRLAFVQAAVHQAGLSGQGWIEAPDARQFKAILKALAAAAPSNQRTHDAEIQFIRYLANRAFLTDPTAVRVSFSHRGRVIHILLPAALSRDEMIFYLKQLGLNSSQPTPWQLHHLLSSA